MRPCKQTPDKGPGCPEGAQPRVEASSHLGHSGGGTGECQFSTASTTCHCPHHLCVHSCIICTFLMWIISSLLTFSQLAPPSLVNQASQMLSCVLMVHLPPCQWLSVLISEVSINKAWYLVSTHLHCFYPSEMFWLFSSLCCCIYIRINITVTYSYTRVIQQKCALRWWL